MAFDPEERKKIIAQFDNSLIAFFGFQRQRLAHALDPEQGEDGDQGNRNGGCDFG
ncbi:MAG: hypothetical protein IPJ48_09310 [Propionivibrio sp.]|uniref:Uncharacterized protein n=1 Tax=Candidatus Propionivibrio dominans TaxID=2954373 RepID=A0A9D7FFC3_9RHOO|nr:hypothetical protein [Candidatus Propionivibrio dominans]MBL0168369.1 hypothetical protein [Propionivibrio sp.]